MEMDVTPPGERFRNTQPRTNASRSSKATPFCLTSADAEQALEWVRSAGKYLPTIFVDFGLLSNSNIPKYLNDLQS